jgi:hypothetical protein
MDAGRLLALAQSDPEEFKRVIKAVSSTVVRPHAGQQLVLDSPARFKVMNCGRRWGKTVLAAKTAVQASRKPKQMIWWVAPTYRITKRGYAEVLRQLPDGVLSKPAPPDTNFDAGRSVILHFKNGSVMEFYSAERPEGMLGAAVDYVVIDEAARMKAATWEQTISPTLIDHLGRALIISTPRGRNWFYKVWQKGQDKAQTEWDSWTFTTQDNPTLPPGEADRMARDMPRLEAEQEIYAKWLAEGSSVFSLRHPNVVQDSAIHPDSFLVEDCPPKGHVMLGIDLGRTNDYTVLYGTREVDRKNVYFERWNGIAWSEQRRRIARAVRTLTASGAEGITLMVDEGNAGSVIVEDLEEAGYDVVGVNFTTHKANMVRLLANDLERGRAFILDEKRDEFEDYQMAMTPTGRFTYSAPEGGHDDVVSAKMLAHWGCVNEGVANIEVIGADDQSAGIEAPPWGADEDTAPDGEWDDLIDEDLDNPAAADEAIGLEPSAHTLRVNLVHNPHQHMLTPEQMFAAEEGRLQPHEADFMFG